MVVLGITVGVLSCTLIGCSDTSLAPAEAAQPGAELNTAAPTWLTDFERAKARAKAEGKDIFINFTGSDWCVVCMKLQMEVFRHAEFLDYAQKNFVLLELDFPQDKTRISEEAFAKNRAIQRKYGVEGFPFVMLTDSQGRPYARSGYLPGGPTLYNQQLAELVAIRQQRDVRFAAAEKLTGIDRAVELNKALRLIPPRFLLPDYESEVEEIVRLDVDNERGLRADYVFQLTARKFQRTVQKIIKTLQSDNDLDAAMQKLQGLRAEYADFREGQLSLDLLEMQLLQIDGRTEEVLKTADRVLAKTKIPPDVRLKAFSEKLTALARAERLEEALDVVDAVRADFSKNANVLAQMLMVRAEFLKELSRPDEARAALAQARRIADVSLLPRIDEVEEKLFPTGPVISPPEGVEVPRPKP